MKRMPVVLSALASAIASFSASADPAPLSLTELDSITAGNWGDNSNPAPNGGAIVGNGSSAVLESTGEVLLSEGAQTDARALNLVNGSESTVANGVNIFDGRTDGSASIDGTEFDISQRNVVEQDQRRLSSLPSYERGANTETITADAGSATSSSAASIYDSVVDIERTTTFEEATTNGGFTASGDPTILITSSGLVEIGEDFHVDGEYHAEFNMPSEGNSLGGTFNGELEFGLAAGEVIVDTEAVDVTVTLPSLDFNFDAMGCLAVNGDCTIDGTRVESSEELSDHSTLYTTDTESASSETWDQSSHETVAAAFVLQDAQAEYIVIDDSQLDVTAGYLVALSGEAQSALRALNAVNAAGSAVANGVNLALHRSGELEIGGGPVYKLSQVNHITHSR
jgi:hypothetical protein